MPRLSAATTNRELGRPVGGAGRRWRRGPGAHGVWRRALGLRRRSGSGCSAGLGARILARPAGSRAGDPAWRWRKRGSGSSRA